MTAKCSCKGVRACAFCEHVRVPSHRLNVHSIGRSFVFCPKCQFCFEVDPRTRQLKKAVIKVHGISVVEEAISAKDEAFLEHRIEETSWIESQSGRQKQDFGPRVNFKKRKVKTDLFHGFPSYMDIVTRSFSRLRSLGDFVPVELCNLKYSPDRGSCIDPHFDDWWLWGERLVTLNLSGGSVLTFSRAQDFNNLTKPTTESENVDYALTTDMICELSRSHNCEIDPEHASIGDDSGVNGSIPSEDRVLLAQPNDVVHVAMPRRSLILVESEARFKWHHSVLREHVVENRLAMTCRELSKLFLDASSDEFVIGQELLEKANINNSL